MRRRLVILFFVVSLVLVFLAFYHVQMIASNHNEAAVAVVKGYSYSSATVEAKRGSIVDRNGTELAQSVPKYILILDPKVISTESTAYNYKDKTVEALCEYFGLDEAEVLEAIESNRESSYVRFGGKLLLDYEQVSAFEEFQTAWNNGTYTFDEKDKDGNPVKMTKEDKTFKIKGVWFETEYQRTYPFSNLASKVIGFTTNDGASGLWGLESYYDDELSGTDGRYLGYLDEDFNLTRTVYDATDGNTLVTTIDAPAQQIIQSNIEAFMAEVGADNVGVLLMNPNNGEIYAMSTNTEYDLNNPTDLSAYYSEDEIASMSDEDKETAYNRVWRNFIINDTFEPGSTAKTMTIAMALEENRISLYDTYYCDGGEAVGGWYIRCANRDGHGAETVADALANSCNDALMQIGVKIGSEIMVDYQEIFNLGQKTGIDLPGEASAEGLLYTAETMRSAELATNSFGQGYNVTMIQQASAIASMINGGYYYQPHLVKEIRNSSGEVIEKIDPLLIRRTISKKTSETMIDLMHGVCENGTGQTARIAGYYMGGKTGAAEKLPRGTGEFTVSFISFIGEDPELLLYVVIDVPNVEDQSSSAIAQYLSREIWTDLFSYYNIYPDEQYLKEGEVIGQTNDNPYVSDAFDTGFVIITNPDPSLIYGEESSSSEE